MSERKRRTKTSLWRQEQVVSAIWNFAADSQFRPEQGTICTIGSGRDKGTKASLKHIHRALTTIMNIFGYDLVDVQ